MFASSQLKWKSCGQLGAARGRDQTPIDSEVQLRARSCIEGIIKRRSDRAQFDSKTTALD